MRYRIKKGSRPLDEIIYGLEFELRDEYYSACGGEVKLHYGVYGGCFEPIEEKKYTGSDMIDFLNYSLNDGINIYDAWGNDLLLCFNKWKKQRNEKKIY